MVGMVLLNVKEKQKITRAGQLRRLLRRIVKSSEAFHFSLKSAYASSTCSRLLHRFTSARLTNTGRALLVRRESGEQVGAEIHAHAPARAGVNACIALNFHVALIAISTERALTFIQHAQPLRPPSTAPPQTL
jgi:hypothetical protein